MISAGHEEQRRARFPALDPEPPKRPLSRRLAWPVAAVVVLVVAGLVVVASGPGARPKATAGLPVVAATGRIVAMTPAGGILLADPNGGRPAVVPGVTVPQNEPAVASPDGRYLAIGNGDLLVFDGARASAVKAHAPAASGPNTITGGFADGDGALVVLTQGEVGGPSPNAGISVVPRGSGPPIDLGTGASAVGDPQALGAFVSVAATGLSTGLSLDSRVELRDSGAAPVVLATAAQLNADVGQSPDLPVNLQASTDPAGNALAVAVVPAGQATEAAGIVVLNRGGHVLGTASAAMGSSNGSSPVWSPDGRSLAYPNFGNTGPDLTIWTTGGPVLTRPHRTPRPTSEAACGRRTALRSSAPPSPGVAGPRPG